MGAGYSTEFGNTNGSNSNPRFIRVNFVGSVKVDGETRDVSRRVYQRNDIDFEYVDPKTGKTNLDLWLRFVKLRIKNTIISCMDCEVKGKVLEMTER